MGGALGGFVVVSLPIAVGYTVARTGLLGPATHASLSRLVFYVLMPVLLFTVLAKAELDVVFSKLALTSFVTALVMFALYSLIAGLVLRRQAGAVVVGALSSGYTNANNIGLPIAIHMLGQASLVAPVILFQTLVFSPIALAALDLGSSRRGSLGRVLVGALANPVALGSGVGLAINLLPWDLPFVVMDALSLIGGAAVPIMLIALGMSLYGRQSLGSGTSGHDAFLAAGFKLLLMPVVAFLLAHFVFGLDSVQTYAAVVLAALPTAGNVHNYAMRFNQATSLARDAITLTVIGGAPVLLAAAAIFA
ncbi:MAG: AEC family transporter [Micrococcales bacterium]|nr:AEC family transporter [Micrococcales bacterium]